MKAMLRNLLSLLILINVSTNALAEDYPPDVTACLTTYTNQTLCMQDCWCGWCNSSQLCLNGSPENPNNSSSNLGHACGNSSDWNFGSECKKFLHAETVLLLVLALGSGVAAITYLTCKFLAKKNVYEYTPVPQYNHYGATPYGDL